ncbi:MAG: hypothetical protein HFF36_12090 [Coprobacillus sp.]|nr:hypothetical protein [Coprobacillus sp.]
MFIYNINQNSDAPHYHILDPDYIYNTYLEKNLLYPYFKNLVKPQNVYVILGIYMEYQIEDYSYQQFPQLYQKFAPSLENKIKKYLDFGCANLFNSNANYFFLTMFNVKETEVEKALLSFSKDINEKYFDRKNKYHYFRIRSGLYFSHPYIDPYEFYNCAKEQFDNTINNNTILSIKPYLLSF